MVPAVQFRADIEKGSENIVLFLEPLPQVEVTEDRQKFINSMSDDARPANFGTDVNLRLPRWASEQSGQSHLRSDFEMPVMLGVPEFPIVHYLAPVIGDLAGIENQWLIDEVADLIETDANLFFLVKRVARH